METSCGRLGEPMSSAHRSSVSRSSRITALLLVLVMSVLLAPRAAMAAATDAGASTDNLSVTVQPEYDDPRVLVIIESTLSADTPLPAKASFDIPKSGVNVGMACELVDGQHNCKPYTLDDDGDYQRLSYNADTSRQLFFEYYYDPLAGQKTAKSFVYEYRAPYDVKRLDIAIQQPLKAENYKIDPASDKSFKDDKGMNIFQYEYDNVPEGRVLTFKVAYDKSDPEPSVSKPVEPIPAASSGEPAKASSSQLLTRLGLLMFAAAAGVAILMASLRMRAAGAGGTDVSVGSVPKGKSKGKPKGKPKKSAISRRNGQLSARFCTGCGEELTTDAKFCPACGNGVDGSTS